MPPHTNRGQRVASVQRPEADATVTVNCHQIAVEKDAEVEFTREYDWDIDKTAFMLNGSDPIASLVRWSGSDHPSGLYFVVMRSGDFVQTRQMTLLR